MNYKVRTSRGGAHTISAVRFEDYAIITTTATVLILFIEQVQTDRNHKTVHKWWQQCAALTFAQRKLVCGTQHFCMPMPNILTLDFLCSKDDSTKYFEFQ